MKTSEIVAYILMIALAPLTALTLFLAFIPFLPLHKSWNPLHMTRMNYQNHPMNRTTIHSLKKEIPMMYDLVPLLN